jgi:uncharacterized membrane protein YphA (DoxX/SURF4 family)
MLFLRMQFHLSELAKSRILRFGLAPWILIGHGIPKLSHWLFGLSAWGPHLEYVPKNSFSAVAAIIEFVCPILILVGFQVRASSFVVSAMLLLSTFMIPFPWFHERVPVEGYQIPFAIIPSKEISIKAAIAFFALTLFGKDEPFWHRNSKPPSL